MIFPNTKLVCKDNSGASIVKCIGILKSSRLWGANVGNWIVISVSSCSKGLRKIQKGSIHYALIIKVKKKLSWVSKTGEYISFNENAVVLLSKKLNFQPLGTWVFGPVAREIWQSNFLKIVLLSSGIF